MFFAGLDSDCFNAESGFRYRLRRRVGAQPLGYFLRYGEWLPLNHMVLAEPDILDLLVKTVGPGRDFPGVRQQHNGCRRLDKLALFDVALTCLAAKINHITHGVIDDASRVNDWFPNL